jgi:hypothetical protein
MRVGNVVTVSGQVSGDTTSGAVANFDLTLPFASNFANANELAGTLTCQTGGGSDFHDAGFCYADATNDRAELQFKANNTATGRILRYTYTYRII